MFLRRPLLRAAASGGAACAAGPSTAALARERHHAQATRDQRSVAYRQVPPQAMPSLSDGLTQLNALHDQGALTDAEFAGAMARLLGG
jgi:hypothetical protein